MDRRASVAVARKRSTMLNGTSSWGVAFAFGVGGGGLNDRSSFV